eukprot:TRINITY_DN57579_c0_g1_i1.p1 TRINITY_DN57579_c0_g1~~TRINITY_DN57579_c0_g1_i1.p1  ORF type:complete len:427 (-),score=34.55 TRINITY_DN57579_c0_g1_i1:1313-2593(-)
MPNDRLLSLLQSQQSELTGIGTQPFVTDETPNDKQEEPKPPAPPQTCAICQEELPDTTTALTKLECGHSLHLNCYTTLLDHQYTACPLCRTLFPHKSKELEEGAPGPVHTTNEMDEALRLFAQALAAPRDLSFEEPRQYTAMELPQLAMRTPLPCVRPTCVTMDKLGRIFALCDWLEEDNRKALQVFQHDGTPLLTMKISLFNTVQCMVTTAAGVVCVTTLDEGQQNRVYFNYEGMDLGCVVIDDMSSAACLAVDLADGTLFVGDNLQAKCFVCCRNAKGYKHTHTITLPDGFTHMAIRADHKIVGATKHSSELITIDFQKEDVPCSSGPLAEVIDVVGKVEHSVGFGRAGIEKVNSLALTLPDNKVVVCESEGIRILHEDFRPLHAFPACAGTLLNWLQDASGVYGGIDGRILVADCGLNVIYAC